MPPDLLIGATDSFGCHSLINGLSLGNNIPAVYGGCWGEASVGEVLYVVPGRTPCFECYAGFRRGTAPLPANDPRKYTDPNFDETKVPGQAGLWPNILIICGIAFQVILALLDPEGDRGRNLIDYDRTLFLINISDYDSPLQPLAVTFGRVSKGCSICDESKLGELGKGLKGEPTGVIGQWASPSRNAEQVPPPKDMPNLMVASAFSDAKKGVSMSFNYVMRYLSLIVVLILVIAGSEPGAVQPENSSAEAILLTDRSCL